MEELALPFLENLMHSIILQCSATCQEKKWTLSARGGGAACSVYSTGYDLYFHIILFLMH